MEPIEEVIENEIEQKSIERTIIEEPEPEPESLVEDTPPHSVSVNPKRRTKKERSPAQIAAFEKARLKRMEIANQKKQIKAKQKEEDNILKEQIKAKLDNETKPVDIPKPTLKKEFVKPRIEQPTPREIVREQVVNNYYYYGEEQPKRRGRKKKIVEPETESESESEEEYIQQPSRPPSPIQQPETYKELQSYKEEAPKKQVVRAQPKLKFSFV
jgi:hypothetical protein